LRGAQDTLGEAAEKARKRANAWAEMKASLGDAKAKSYDAAGALDALDRLAHASSVAEGGAGAGDSAADALTSRLRQRWEQQRLLVAASVVTTKTSLELIHAAAAGGEVRDGAARASSPEMKGAMRTTLVGAAVLTAVRFESLTLPLEQLHQSLKIAALAPSIARRKQASQAIASAQGNLRALAVLDESRDAFALGGLGVDAAAAVAASAAAYAAVRTSVRASNGFGASVRGTRRDGIPSSNGKSNEKSNGDVSLKSNGKSNGFADADSSDESDDGDGDAAAAAIAAGVDSFLSDPDLAHADEAERYACKLSVFDLIPKALTADKAKQILEERAIIPEQMKQFMEATVSPVVQEALFAACCVRPRQPVLFVSEFLFKAATGRARWSVLKSELRNASASNRRLRAQLAAAGVGVDGLQPGALSLSLADSLPSSSSALALTPAPGSGAMTPSAELGGSGVHLTSSSSSLQMIPHPSMSALPPATSIPAPPPSASLSYEVFLNEAAGLVVCLCRLLPGCTLEPIVTSDQERGTTTLVLRIEPPYQDTASHPKALLQSMPRALALANGLSLKHEPKSNGSSSKRGEDETDFELDSVHGGSVATAAGNARDEEGESAAAADLKWKEFARRADLGSWRTVRGPAGARLHRGSLRMLAELHEIKLPYLVKESECECETIDSRKAQTRTTAIVMPLDTKLTAGRSLGRRKA